MLLIGSGEFAFAGVCWGLKLSIDSLVSFFTLLIWNYIEARVKK